MRLLCQSRYRRNKIEANISIYGDNRPLHIQQTGRPCDLYYAKIQLNLACWNMQEALNAFRHWILP